MTISTNLSSRFQAKFLQSSKKNKKTNFPAYRVGEGVESRMRHSVNIQPTNTGFTMEIAPKGSMLPMIRQLEYWFIRKPEGFYKFLEPCDHGLYRDGDSWSEELNINRRTFTRTFDKVGTRYKSKKAFLEAYDKFQGKLYASYFSRLERKTYFFKNHDLINAMADERYERAIAKTTHTEDDVRSRDIFHNNVRSGNVRSSYILDIIKTNINPLTPLKGKLSTKTVDKCGGGFKNSSLSGRQVKDVGDESSNQVNSGVNSQKRASRIIYITKNASNNGEICSNNFNSDSTNKGSQVLKGIKTQKLHSTVLLRQSSRKNNTAEKRVEFEVFWNKYPETSRTTYKDKASRIFSWLRRTESFEDIMGALEVYVTKKSRNEYKAEPQALQNWLYDYKEIHKKAYQENLQEKNREKSALEKFYCEMRKNLQAEYRPQMQIFLDDLFDTVGVSLSWYSGLSLGGVREGTLYLRAPNLFVFDSMNNNHMETLELAARGAGFFNVEVILGDLGDDGFEEVKKVPPQEAQLVGRKCSVIQHKQGYILPLQENESCYYNQVFDENARGYLDGQDHSISRDREGTTTGAAAPSDSNDGSFLCDLLPNLGIRGY